MSIEKSTCCVNLSTLPPNVWESLQNEDFTVMRRSKKGGESTVGDYTTIEETGWRIQQRPHSNCCCSGYNKGIGPTDNAHLGDAVASKFINMDKHKNHIWSVFMNNGWKSRYPDFIHEHACGWYVCDPSQRTFWPTRCKLPLEKESWWAWFDLMLKSLPTFKKSISMWPILHVWSQEPVLGVSFV